MLKQLNCFIKEAKKRDKRTVSVAVAEDEDVLKAVHMAHEEGIADFILVGNEEKIKSICEALDIEQDFEIVNKEDPLEALKVATELVTTNKADALMKGMINTSDFLRGVLQNKEMRTGKLLSHLAVYEIPKSEKLVYHADTGMNMFPNVEEKEQILGNSIKALERLGIEKPKVALLAANEKVNEKMPTTTDAATLVEIGKEKFSNAIIEGPIAMDVALDPKAAAVKGIDSEITGDVDLFLVPDIEAGNILGKGLLYYTDGKVAGVILGASCPIILTSRAESAEGKLYSIALSCLVA